MNTVVYVNDTHYQKISRLLDYGMSRAAIAHSMNFTLDELNGIIDNDPQYAAFVGDRLSDKVDSMEQRNDSWDSIEQMALQNVAQQMQFGYGNDIETSLKIATLANKAQRRKEADLTAQNKMNSSVTLNVDFADLIARVSQSMRTLAPVIDSQPKQSHDCIPLSVFEELAHAR